MPDLRLALLLFGEGILDLHEEILLFLSEFVDFEEIITNQAVKVVLFGMLEHPIDIVDHILDLTSGDDSRGLLLPVPHSHLIVGSSRDGYQPGLGLDLGGLFLSEIEADEVVRFDICRGQNPLLLFR